MSWSSHDVMKPFVLPSALESESFNSELVKPAERIQHQDPSSRLRTTMSDIIEAIKDAVNPKRREQATAETYDAHKRGPYPDRASAGTSQPEVAPPAEAQNPGRAEQSDLSSTAAGTDSSRSPKLASSAGYSAPPGTYGPHKSRVANAADPRVDSDRDGNPSHGLSDYGGAAAKPVHKEGGKYGLS